MTRIQRMLTVRAERFPLATPFTISRGSRTHAEVVVATIVDGDIVGRGECTPYGRYGETTDSVIAAIEEQTSAVADGVDRATLLEIMPPGAARNALDCALWDVEAKRAGERVWSLAGLPEPKPTGTAYTISLGDPAAMENAARKAKGAGRDLLKVKLGGGDGGDGERMRAVRRAAPDAMLVVDANEGWEVDELEPYLAAARVAGVAMVEQPLPAGEDDALEGMRSRGILLGADESVHVTADVEVLSATYDVLNLKLDKTGGLTDALAFVDETRRCGATLMVGCMMGTSLAMAPALLPAQSARFVDLDGPLWLAQDRDPGLSYGVQTVQPPEERLWG